MPKYPNYENTGAGANLAGTAQAIDIQKAGEALAARQAEFAEFNLKALAYLGSLPQDTILTLHRRDGDISFQAKDIKIVGDQIVKVKRVKGSFSIMGFCSETGLKTEIDNSSHS